jgi:cytoskeletal protein CcmA (bactofilin family)
MWGNKKPETSPLPPSREAPGAPAPDVRSLGEQPLAKAGARLGRTLSLKGELAGSEPLTLDGEFEGTIDLAGSSLTVGPSGRVQADIRARDITIEGTVRGTLRAADRLQIARTGNVAGDLVAARIVIEDGAYFKGSIDIQKPDEKPARSEPAGESFRIAPVPLAAKDKLQ